jgi:hypothetical protein
VLSHRFGKARGLLGENWFQLRMNRTLAAIHRDCQIEPLIEFVEGNVVLIVEGVPPDCVWPEVGVYVVPVQADPPTVTEVDREGSWPTSENDNLHRQQFF